MGNNSVQITRPSWITQETDELDLAERGLGKFVVPGRGSAVSNSAHRPATLALSDGAVGEVSTSLSLPEERVSGHICTRRIPLCTFVVHCSARNPGQVCMDLRVPRLFRRFLKGHAP